jgi:HlyD family secretion protein
VRVLKKIITILIVMALIIGLFGGIGYGAYWFYALRNQNPVKVRFTTSQIGDLKVILKETATLQPKKTVQVKSKVAGRILRLHYEAGDIIQSGSVIAELDREQYERKLEQCERDLSMARQKMNGLMPFGKVVTEPEKIDPSSLEILVDKTLIEYGAAKADLENKKEMFKRNLISLKSLDDAQKQFDRSFVAYHDQVRSASMDLPRSVDAYEQAVEDLHETTIRAPVAGVITILPVHEGELVQGTAGMTQGTTLAEVADLAEMQAVVKLNEVDIAKIKVGDPVTLTLDSVEDKEYKGKVEIIAPAGVNKNNIVVFEVKIALTDKSDIFRPEMTANADILVGEATHVVKVPLEAIEEKEGIKKVTLLTLKEGAEPDPTATPTEDESSATTDEKDFYKTDFGKQEHYEEKKVEVKTGLTNELWTEVIEGLKDEVLLKLPEVKIPERKEGPF